MKIVLRVPLDDEIYEELSREVGAIIISPGHVASRAEIEEWAVKKLLHGMGSDLTAKKPEKKAAGQTSQARPAQPDKKD